MLAVLVRLLRLIRSRMIRRSFIADGIGLRTFLFAIPSSSSVGSSICFLLTIEGDRPQFWRTEIIEGKLKGLDVQRRTA